MNKLFFQILFLGSVLILLLVAYSAFNSLREFNEDAIKVEHSERVKQAIDNVESVPNNFSIQIRGAAILGNDLDEGLLAESRQEMDQYFHTLDSMLDNSPVQKQNLNKLVKFASRQEDLARKLFNLLGKENYDRDSLQYFIRQEAHVNESIQFTARLMKNEENQKQIKRNQDREASSKLAPITLLGLAVVALVIIIYLYLKIFELLRQNEATSKLLESKVVALNHEVENRKLAEGLLRSVLDSSPYSVSAFRSIRNEAGEIVDFEYLMVNDVSVGTMNRSREELLNSTLLQVTPGNKESGLMEIYRNVVETGETRRVEEFYDEDGFEAWFSITAVKQGDGFVVTYLDITQQKRREEELIEKTYALQQSNEELEHFAYIASHDLQEPLRKVRAFGDRLKNVYEDQLDDRGKDYLDRMQNAAERMQILIDDLLKFSRVSRSDRNFEPVRLDKVLEDVIEDLEIEINKRKVELNCPTLPMVNGDAAQLRQLFQNLISNAIKYTPTERTPKIDISCDEMPRDGRISSEEENCWRISISDNGIGFDPKYKEQIFVIFQRLHGRSEFSGTGIGLAICQKIVLNHGGIIEADSIPGEGSVFNVYLPKKDESN